MLILAADIGGTSSRFALFSILKGKLSLEKIIQKKTKEYTSFFEILEEIASEDSSFSFDSVSSGVLALPGPVNSKNDVVLTNVSWSVPIRALRQQYNKTSFYVVNDFIAQVYGCLALKEEDCIIIQKGKPDPGGVLAAIGAGTGLGHGAAIPLPSQKYIPLPSEGGHSTFSFLQEEHSYESFLKKRLSLSYITKEIVVSGKGLSLLHEFLTGRYLSPPEVVSNTVGSSLTTMLFSSFYARACRDLCLYTLPTRGLFITGGIAISNPWIIDNNMFRKEFNFSFSHSQLLGQIPVYLLRNEANGLWGAIYYFLQCLSGAEHIIGFNDSFS